ncbi:MAG: C39 family peptidase [Anaerolineae bacterium]|nr:C39 family peptidase [Anaerolineae bacterium]
MKAGRFHAFILAALITLAPFGRAVGVPAAAVAVDPAKVTQRVVEQTQERDGLRDRLQMVPNAGAAREGNQVDMNQPSVAMAASQGGLKVTPETRGGIAYVSPYVEPNDYAHRNYCGAGAATVLISHWDPEFPQKVDIDQLGEEMNLDPDSGVWIRDIVKPVNDRVNAAAGQELNWYRYGKAATKDDFRFMLDYDIRQHGVPLITGVMTRGLPGWGQTNVGHIVAVYGYTEDADGKEWVTYADTAPEVSGYRGQVMQTVDLDTFWNAVSENSAQVW